MYSFGNSDRYRCEAGKCDCGEQYKLAVVSLPGHRANDPTAIDDVAKAIRDAELREKLRAPER